MHEELNDVDPGLTALFLDIDGTLLEISDTPDAVQVTTALVSTLDRAAERLGGALALVSGRQLAEIDRLFQPSSYPAAGSHGAEIRFADGSGETPETDNFPAWAWHQLREFAEAYEGILIERKLGGASLHYRMKPALETYCRKFAKQLMADLGDGYRLIDGKMVLEIAPLSRDKGQAICKFLKHPTFDGRIPVFIGDDVTDEDGFRAVNALGGITIRVGGGDTAAQYALDDVSAVHAWLNDNFQ